jgi:hypothetical protein
MAGTRLAMVSGRSLGQTFEMMRETVDNAVDQESYEDQSI